MSPLMAQDYWCCVAVQNSSLATGYFLIYKGDLTVIHHFLVYWILCCPGNEFLLTYKERVCIWLYQSHMYVCLKAASFFMDWRSEGVLYMAEWAWKCVSCAFQMLKRFSLCRRHIQCSWSTLCPHSGHCWQMHMSLWNCMPPYGSQLQITCQKPAPES